MGGMIMTPEEYIDQMKIQEVSWNGDICENEPTGDYILSEEDALEAVRMAREDEKRVVKEKCEKLFRGFLLKAFLKSASNEPFDQEGEFKKLMDKI